jgi:hypothetical protein
LKPLAWLVGLLLTALIISFPADAPTWVTACLLVGIGLSVFLYMASYVFCLFHDRDALRSERYSLHKMAIEAGIYGDSRTGLIEVTPERITPPALTAQVPGTSESGE